MSTDDPMQLGVVGLGRMGANIVRRLMRDGHTCVVFDVDADAIEDLEKEGATGASSVAELVEKLSAPRAAWVMVPSGEITGKTIEELASHMERGDTIIDGGNSYYRPIFSTIAPGIDSASRTPGRSGEPDPAEHGFLHCGPNGAGHFVKMVHNGIEYAMMAAFAEGLNVLDNANAGSKSTESDAETAPMEDPEFYQYDIDTAAVAEVWRRGSVVESWLLDLTATALYDSPDLAAYAGRVSDSGEGRWTSIAAIDESVPAPVLTTALYSRFASRGLDDFADKVLSAMRKGFGGHDEKKA